MKATPDRSCLYPRSAPVFIREAIYYHPAFSIYHLQFRPSGQDRVSKQGMVWCPPIYLD
jgi:hypothetical protein